MDSYCEEYEPAYGRRLLPVVVDDAARQRPKRVVYSFPRSEDPADGFHDITNQRYANSVNRAAWLLEESFGMPKPRSFPSIGYIGPNDLRYAILIIAAVKVGYKMLLLSPRNSIEGHLAVIDRCGCDLWLLPIHRLGRVDQILETRAMKTESLPELLELLQDDPVPPYPYNKNFEEARQDPFVVLHTSGSTGLPKPVTVTNGSVATPDAQHTLPPIEGRLTQAQLFLTPYKVYSTFPMFHSAGMVFCCAMPFFYELSVSMGPASVPVNLLLVNSMFDHANVDGSLLAPSTIEEISKDLASFERIAKTSFTFYGGGPLSKECGDKVNAVCKIHNVMGVTEGSLFPVVQAEGEDWHYHHFHPAGGFTFQQRSEELWEQFQTRDPELDLFQAFFQTFPDQNEVAIKDLYSKHPTKPGRWLYRGRTDDVIVLSNGEKVNPLDMEACINSHPAVKASLVVGQGRFQTTALIQLQEPLPPSKEGIETLKESLWPKVAAANIEAPAHAQLDRDHIMFATPEKPFILAGKETVLRSMTVQLYEHEIDEFYATREDPPSSQVVCLDATDIASIQRGILDLLHQTLGNTLLTPNADFFDAGLDSLLVFKVLASLRATFRTMVHVENGSVTASLIYSNPTAEKLSAAIDRLVRPVDGAHISDTTGQMMKELLERYTSDLSDRLHSTFTVATPFSVILTGSTGSLGSYLLDDLLSTTAIQRVYCLNRCVNGRARQLQAMESRGLTNNLSPERVKFLQVDLSKHNFGLDGQSYDELLCETTHIIHNQWQVDFNLTLPSFEPLVRGVRHLIDFAIQSAINPTVFFISSVGVVKNQRVNASVPESLVTDFTLAEGGYGRSKLISELVLEKASSKSGVRCSICRLGQIAGPVDVDRGMWNKQEWLPSIIASSKYLNMVPLNLPTLDRVDWLPVNQCSRVIMELAGLFDAGSTKISATPFALQVFHALNPSTTSWSSLVPSVAASLGPHISVVPWGAWLSALEASEERGDYEQNPGIKLLDFYRNANGLADKGLELPLLETKKSKEKSPTLRELGPVTREWMAQWMKQWGF